MNGRTNPKNWPVIVLFLLVILSSNVWAYSGGDGSAEYPYRIATPNDMNEIGANPADWDANFVMVNDINLAEYTGNQFNVIGYTTMIESYPFTGVFDGNGHTISNFTYTTTYETETAIFGFADAEIKDLGLINPDVNAVFCVGALVAFKLGGTLSNCYVEGGSIWGQNFVGGLVGENRGALTNCYSSTSVTGSSYYAGGLAGVNRGVVKNSYANGSVDGNDMVGGLVGENYGTISKCYSSASVSGSDFVGGLIGNSMAIVTGSYWDTQTSGQPDSAGGIGKTTEQMHSASTYIGWGCELVWTIDDGNDYPRLYWQVLPGMPLPEQHLSDFLVGDGTESEPYLIYTIEDFNTIALFSCDWDQHFKLMTDMNLANVAPNNPIIIGYYGFPFTGVFDGNKHTISNFKSTLLRHRAGFFGRVGGKNAQIKGLGLINPQVGIVDGGNTIGSLVGHLEDGTITGCFAQGGSISGRYSVGALVGDNNGIITNSYATGSINGTPESMRLGGLAGNNEGSIYNCYATGTVTGADLSICLGGLVGDNHRGTITNCYATGSITAGKFGSCIGGLVGRSTVGTITNCFAKGSVAVPADGGSVGGLVGGSWRDTISNCCATGSVTGGEGGHCIGGLVGKKYLNTISQCFSTGPVTGTYDVGGLVGDNEDANILASFWDVNTSGRLDGVGSNQGSGTIDLHGLTTAEMQTKSTFTDAGWDFVGEVVNEANDIWTINESVDYPKHVWPLVNFVGWYEADFADWAVFASRWFDSCPVERADTDITKDGIVDIKDFCLLAASWFENNCGSCGGADLTGDGSVNYEDLSEFVLSWLMMDFGCQGADLDFSGSVDLADLQIFCDHWLEATVP